MGLTIYCDGEFVPEEEAKVSVFDHGFLYGDGIFEGIRAYHGRVFKLAEHLKRLYESARSIHLDIGLPVAEMERIVIETCRLNQIRDGYIRLVVSRGKGDLGLDPLKCSRAATYCIADQIKLYPPSIYEEGMELRTVAIRRNNPDSLNPRIKSLNYLNNILAKIEANLAGIPEGVLLNQEGYVAECTGDNIFIVQNGVLKTPPGYVGILEGITRNTVLSLAEKRGLKTSQELFTRHDLYTADECFLTGTAAELVPVVKIDGRVIGQGTPGETFKGLLREFRETTLTDGPEIFR
ncbi:branched-chain-amino-acid transaminase [Acididesulfobacillus acetoxydans]|uniref:Branched-chain-amino-acid aminotransferase n=1 Tax=Acididesulfobacillus acetoxydans TaxID=1561005 RepID=A0A8S0WG78_9FIRM|nr:branched-chain-amino-acid transaminase [Acididesulfobacillus acetoxydans]CAA7601662.1 branched-chain-amino-acid transaminase [Acididesulfobacillus acetoxydans]CEJ06328.1 Branched-chain-amino-acid aminotransferase-like protein 1 [Acididesulfobacillus acetoxydans]